MIRDLHRSLSSNYYLPKSFAITFLALIYLLLGTIGIMFINNHTHKKEILEAKEDGRRELYFEMNKDSIVEDNSEDVTFK